MMLEDRIEEHFRKDRTVHFAFGVILLALMFIGLFGLYGMDSPTGFSVSTLGNETENETNTPPEIAGIPDQNISAGETFEEVDLYSYSADNETAQENLTYASTEEKVIDMSIRDERYLVANITDEDWNGTEVVNVTVIDGGGLEDSDTVAYTVRGNRPPQLDVQENATATEGDLVTMNPAVSDPEGHSVTVTYSAPFDPDGEWQISQEYTENMTATIVTVTATDELGASTQANATIFVLDEDAPSQVGEAGFTTGEQEINVSVNYSEPCFLRAAYRTNDQSGFPDDQVLHDLTEGAAEEDVPSYRDYERLRFYSSLDTLSEVMVLDSSHSITIGGLSAGTDYNFNFTCFDTAKNTHVFLTTKTTDKAPMALPSVETFNGRTTDFETENVSCVPNAVLEKKKYGRVEYLDTCMDFSGLDVDSNLEIGHGTVKANASEVPSLKTEANVYLYNLSLDDPGIRHGGEPCGESKCNIIEYDEKNDTIAFWVKWVTQYAVVEKGSLSIKENVDNNTAYMGDDITISAHFDYYGKPFEGPNGDYCTLSFPLDGNETTYDMSYESEKGTYEKTFTLENETAFNYTVTCDGSYKGLGTYEEKDKLEILYSPVCGDGFCDSNSTEDCETCEADCGECPCVANWTCSNWSECEDGIQTRNCTDLNNCTNATEPNLTQECTPPADVLCSNGEKDPDEEGVDCGGICDEPCPNCSDGIKNQGEEGVDCGGPCPDCATCSDGKLNQQEEEVDCGGPNCPPCPNCSDGKQNQGEEGVDCGGPCPECEPSDDDENESGNGGVEPRPEQPSGGGMSVVALVMIIMGVVVVFGGAGAAVYFYRDTIFGASSGTTSSQPDDGLVHYLQQNLMQNYSPDQLRSVLVEGGWDTQQVDEALKKAHNNIVQQYVAQLEPIIAQYDLSNPQVLFGILNTGQYPPEVMKETIKKILRERYPPDVSNKLLPYVN